MRLAYQLIGQDGPIPNPRRIGYLPADGTLTGSSPNPIAGLPAVDGA